MKIAKLMVAAVMLLAVTAATSCGGSGSSSGGGGSSSCGIAAGTVDAALAGDWRILTETIYFDNGLTQDVTPVTTLLSLAAGGTWTFGSSSGTWSVSNITASDWTTWDIADYGAARKVILEGWDGCPGDGPIDEPNVAIDNIWVIYGYTSDTNGPGTVWLKFGAN